MKKVTTFIWKLIVKIAHGILSVIYGIIHKELTDEAFEAWLQFIKFGMVGVFNTVLNYVLTMCFYSLFSRHLQDTLSMQIAQTLGFIITVFTSFLLNNNLVFKKKEGQYRNPWLTLLKTYIAYSVTGLFLNNVLIYVEMSVFGVPAAVAPIMNIVVDVPVNFFLNKLWAYRTKPASGEKTV